MAVCRKSISQRLKNYGVECLIESPVKENKGAKPWWCSTVFFFVCWASSSIASFLIFMVYAISGFEICQSLVFVVLSFLYEIDNSILQQ